MDTRRSPPFTAPATLERQRTKNWLSVAKERFMKPWKLRSQRRPRKVVRKRPRSPYPVQPQQTSLTTLHENPNNTRQDGFPNFSRLSPLGGVAQPREQAEDVVNGVSDGKWEGPKVPEGSKPTRPLLSNMFPIMKEGQVAVIKTTTTTTTTIETPAPPTTTPAPPTTMMKTPALPTTTKTPAPPTTTKTPAPATTTMKTPAPPITTKALAPPTNRAPTRPRSAADIRCHSTPVSPNLFQLPSKEIRRRSAGPDISARHGRRERRASITREIPLLPKRGQDPYLSSSLPNSHTHSEPVSPYNEPHKYDAPYSEYNDPHQYDAPRILAVYSDKNQITFDFRPDMGSGRRPPVGPGGTQGNFSYPHTWQQPCEQLQELEKELDEDGEGDGEAERAEEWVESKPPPPVISQRPPTTPTRKGTGLGGNKFLQMISSSGKQVPKVKKIEGVLKGKTVEEEEPVVKGFDGFFMY